MKTKLCWFNQQWNIYLSSEKGERCWNKLDDIFRHINSDSGIFRLTMYEVETYIFYTYGLIMDNVEDRPGHGGEWSSRCAIINPIFGINTTEVFLDGISVAVDVEVLRELIGANFIIKSSMGGGKEILSTDGSTHPYLQWITPDMKEISREPIQSY